jgi:hypothetical protein
MPEPVYLLRQDASVLFSQFDRMINIDCRRASSNAGGANHPLTEDRLASLA